MVKGPGMKRSYFCFGHNEEFALGEVSKPVTIGIVCPWRGFNHTSATLAFTHAKHLAGWETCCMELPWTSKDTTHQPQKHVPLGARSHAASSSEDGWEHVQHIGITAELDAYNIVDPAEGASGDCKLGGDIDDQSSMGTYEDPEVAGPNSQWSIIGRDDL